MSRFSVRPLRLRIHPEYSARRLPLFWAISLGIAAVLGTFLYSGGVWSIFILVLFLAIAGFSWWIERRNPPHWDWLKLDSHRRGWVATEQGLRQEIRHEIRISEDTRIFWRWVLLVFTLSEQRRDQVLLLTQHNLGEEELRQLRVRLLWQEAPDNAKSSLSARLTGLRKMAAGILSTWNNKAGESAMPQALGTTPVEHLLSEDPDHVYSEDELDAIEAIDPELALRLDRAQTFALRAQADTPDLNAPVDEQAVRMAIDEARKILSQDGGDLEYVGLQDRIVLVRLKGACVGCPRSTLDLKNVVERLVKSRAPGVHSVSNQF